MGASLWSEGILQVLIVLLGAPMGSFAACLADRLPRGEPISLARSFCRSCGQALRWWELIPIFSYIGLRGRCARCNAVIPQHLFQAEIAGFVLGVLAVWANLGLIGAMALWCLLGLILADLVYYRLPNLMTLALFLLALVFVTFRAGIDASDAGLLWQAVLGASVGAGVFYAISWIYLLLRGRSGLGAGDIRLMAGIGALVVPASGWVGLAMVTLIAGLAGLLLGLTRAMRRGRALSAKMPVPFGACLAMATVIVWVAAIAEPVSLTMP